MIDAVLWAVSTTTHGIVCPLHIHRSRRVTRISSNGVVMAF
jgi:hypothetical protein